MEIKEVLEWYADENNWKPRGDAFNPKPPLVTEDLGNIAREALLAHFPAQQKKKPSKKKKAKAETIQEPQKVSHENKFKIDYQQKGDKRYSRAIQDEPYVNNYKPKKGECITDSEIDKKLNKKLKVKKDYTGVQKREYQKPCPVCNTMTDIGDFHVSLGEKKQSVICQNCYRAGRIDYAD